MHEQPIVFPRPVQQLLSAISAQASSRLLASIASVSLAKGSFLWLAGDAARHVYFQLDGFCHILSHPLAESPSSVAMGTPGQLLGEAEVIAGSVRTSEVVIREQATFLRINAGHFLAALDEDPLFCRAMLQIANAKFLAMLDYSSAMQSRNARARTAYVACLIGDLCGREAKGDGLDIPFFVSQETLAAYAGTTRQTVNRLLAEWTAAGLLDSDEGRMHIPDLTPLRELAGMARSPVTLTLDSLLNQLKPGHQPAG